MQSSGKEPVFTHPATIEFSDGGRLEAALIMPRQNMTIMEILNRGLDFLEVQMLDGDVVNIARSAIRSIKSREVPKVKELSAHLADKGRFDPHAILRVPQSADAEAIRHSYLALVREYHPDSYASVPLPKEVAEYLNAMLKRINAAYTILAPRTEQAA
jgi:DnaJ-domain-containing protein 1